MERGSVERLSVERWWSWAVALEFAVMNEKGAGAAFTAQNEVEMDAADTKGCGVGDDAAEASRAAFSFLLAFIFCYAQHVLLKGIGFCFKSVNTFLKNIF